jgi:hypothetical protein
MFDRFLARTAPNHPHSRVRGLLDRLGNRAAPRHPHSRRWNDGGVHLPTRQLAPVVIRSNSAHRARR